MIFPFANFQTNTGIFNVFHDRVLLYPSSEYESPTKLSHSLQPSPSNAQPSVTIPYSPLHVLPAMLKHLIYLTIIITWPNIVLLIQIFCLAILNILSPHF